MGTYDRQIASAQRLIAAKGQTVTWAKAPVASAGSIANPTSYAAPVTHQVKVAFLPLGREYLRTIQSVIKDTDIAGGFLQGLMGQVPFKPEITDKVTRRVNGVDEVYGILRDNGIEEIDPNGEGTILYIVRFTR